MEDPFDVAKKAPCDDPALWENARRLRNVVSEQLHCVVEHNIPSSYCDSHVLVVYCDRLGRASSPDDSRRHFRLAMFLSMRGSFATIVTRERLPTARPETWVLRAMGQSISETQKIYDFLVSCLENVPVAVLQGEVLLANVPNVVTQMDGVQANLFEALFSEIN